MIKVMTEAYNDMSDLFEKRKKEIGETAELVSTTTSEMDTAKERLADDEDFLASLTSRCATKKAAIAEAIAILNSDAAFATFGKNDATSTGATSFVQFSESQNADMQKVASTAAAALARSSKKLGSVRLAKIAMELSSKNKVENPFVKVLENINGTVDLIDAEEADDSQKLATCNKEQDINNKKRDDKKAKMDELTASISELEISAKSTKKQISETEVSLADNRASQKESTDARNEANAIFKTNLKNLEDAERILAKATKVLVKYYKYLHSHNAEKTYREVDGKDSGGGNLRQITPGYSDPVKIDLELQEACSAEPECVAYNSAGWLKSSLAPESDWYAWDGGKLFIKELDGVPATEAGTGLLQSKSKSRSRQPADVDFGKEDAEFADSQSGSGNKVIDMLNFIAGETAEEKKTAVDTEDSAQGTFDDEMKTAKEAEKAALANAVSTLKATPIFQRFVAEAEKEAM